MPEWELTILEIMEVRRQYYLHATITDFGEYWEIAKAAQKKLVMWVERELDILDHTDNWKELRKGVGLT